MGGKGGKCWNEEDRDGNGSGSVFSGNGLEGRETLEWGRQKWQWQWHRLVASSSASSSAWRPFQHRFFSPAPVSIPTPSFFSSPLSFFSSLSFPLFVSVFVSLPLVIVFLSFDIHVVLSAPFSVLALPFYCYPLPPFLPSFHLLGLPSLSPSPSFSIFNNKDSSSSPSLSISNSKDSSPSPSFIVSSSKDSSLSPFFTVSSSMTG